MKIGFDAKRIFHNFRGLGAYGRTLVSGLDKYFPDDHYYLYTPPYNDRRVKDWELKCKNLNVITPKTKLTSTFSSAWRSLFLSQVIKKDNLDIFHGLSHEIPPGIQKLGIKTVVSMHDLIFMRRPEFFPFIDRQVYLKKFKYAVQTADLVVAICEQTKEDLIELLKVDENKIKVAYQSCNPRFYQHYSENELEKVRIKFNLPNKYILQVGALESNKNAKGVIKAFANIEKEIEHSLIFVGRGGNYKQEMMELIEKLKLSHKVRIIENVGDPDLPHVYQMADLFMFPSFYEGFGIPILEALFSHTPVIATDDGCFRESGGAHTCFINPEDVEQMSSEMLNVLTDEQRHKAMVRKGREHAENFHLKNTSKVLHALYQGLA